MCECVCVCVYLGASGGFSVVMRFVYGGESCKKSCV